MIESQNQCSNDFWVFNITGRILRDVYLHSVNGRSVFFYRPKREGQAWAARDEAIEKLRAAADASSRGETVESIGLYKWAIALHGTLWEAFVNVAAEFMRIRKYYAAKLYLLRAVELRPDDLFVRLQLGSALRALWAGHDPIRGTTLALSALQLDSPHWSAPPHSTSTLADALSQASLWLMERAEAETLPEAAASDLDTARAMLERAVDLGKQDAWCDLGDAKDLRSNIPSRLCRDRAETACDARADFALKREAVRTLATCIEKQPRLRRAYVRVDQILTGMGETTSQLARALWLRGAELGVFQHPLQRPSILHSGLRALPIWPKQDFWFVPLMEASYPLIREEMLMVLGDSGEFVTDGFARTGEWTKYDLYLNGYRHRGHAAQCPQTLRVVEQVREATSMVSGNIKFSRLLPGTHIPLHSGPSNARLRLHLGLVAPVGAFLSVAGDEIEWREGEAFVFDDSFEHEVHHRGDTHRVILILDFWHPDIPPDRYASMAQARSEVVLAHQRGTPPEIDGPADHYRIIRGSEHH